MAITSAWQQEQNGMISKMDDTCFFSKIYHAVVSLRFDFRIVEMWAMLMPHGEFDPVEIRIAVTVGGDSKSSARMGFTAPRRWERKLDRLDGEFGPKYNEKDRHNGLYSRCLCIFSFLTSRNLGCFFCCGVYPHGN